MGVVLSMIERTRIYLLQTLDPHYVDVDYHRAVDNEKFVRFRGLFIFFLNCMQFGVGNRGLVSGFNADTDFKCF